MLVVATTWPDVGLALIAALPGLLAAIYSILNRNALKTPSGTSIGRQVESTHHVSLGNSYRLQRMQKHMNIDVPAEAAHEENASEFLRTDGEE